MTDLEGRLREQFSYEGEGAAIWRGFDRFLDTDGYLNLGYSRAFESHLVGSPQERLAREVVGGLSANVEGSSLLDVGCGRGGPAGVFESAGYDVTGIDLVRYNVELATENADGSFVVGDATHLPFADSSFDACVSVDAPLYFPDKDSFFAEARCVLHDDGVLGISDLVVPDDLTDAEREDVQEFADAWDMAGVSTSGEYGEYLGRNGFEVVKARNVTRNSIGRFGKWALLYLVLDSVGVQRPFLECAGVDTDDVSRKVEATYPALEHMEHVILYANPH